MYGYNLKMFNLNCCRKNKYWRWLMNGLIPTILDIMMIKHLNCWIAKYSLIKTHHKVVNLRISFMNFWDFLQQQLYWLYLDFFKILTLILIISSYNRFMLNIIRDVFHKPFMVILKIKIKMMIYHMTSAVLWAKNRNHIDLGYLYIL